MPYALLLLALLAASAHAQTDPQRLVPEGLEAFSEFGVAVAAGRDVLAVGAPGPTGPGADAGAVFVYVPSDVPEERWALQTRLLAPGVVGRGYVGGSVDVSPDGQWIVAGAPLDEAEGIGTGAAFVWRRAGDGWTFEGRLVAGDAEAFDEFGQSVAISDDGETVVGAPFEGDGPTGGGGGAAYVFTRGADGAWAQTAKLQPDEIATGDTFGRSVAIHGGVVAVGTPVPGPLGLPQPPTDPGYVYLFARDQGGPGAWGQTQRITGDDSVNGDFFGGAVDLAPGFLAVGANQDQDAGPVTGAVYLFQSTAGTWNQATKIVPPGAENQDGIGFSVALAGDGTGRVAFSALGDDDAGENAGAVYLYRPCSCGGDWIAEPKLIGTGLDDRYGWSVGAYGADVVVGAPQDAATGFASGAAYASIVPFVLAGEAGGADRGLSLGAPRPNPSAGRAQIALTSTGAAPVRVTVVDALGRTVATIADGTVAPGATTLALPVLAPGVYTVVAQQGGAVSTQRVIVAR